MKYITFFTFLLVPLMLLSHYAYSEDWVGINYNKSAAFFVDNASITETKDAGIFEARIKTKYFREYDLKNDRLSHNIDFFRFYCRDYKYALLKTYGYNSKGKIITENTPKPIVWNEVSPKTIQEGWYNYVCIITQE